MRNVEWPDSLRAEEGCYDKYEGYRFSIMPRAELTDVKSLKCDNTKIITYKFKVKDTAKPGTYSDIFCPNDAMYTFNKLDVYDAGEAENKPIAPCWQFYRSNKDSNACLCYLADESYQFDKTLDITGTRVTVAGAQVEYADYTALDAAIAGFDSFRSLHRFHMERICRCSNSRFRRSKRPY